MEPKTDRKIRSESTNALKCPEMYDLSSCQEVLIKQLNEQEEQFAPNKKPRFINRICNTPEPVYHPFTREIGFSRVLYCINGFGLLIGDDGTTKCVTAGSGIFIPSGFEYDLLLGRGSQNWITSHWEGDSPIMSTPDFQGAQTFAINNTTEVFKNLTATIVSDIANIEKMPYLILSWLYMFIHESSNHGMSFSLSPPLEPEAENIHDLVTSIKANPAQDWNLSAAAEVAGYSPFHLSRLFRSTVNMGLPQFVEACRTEIAIEELLNGKTPMNVLFENCGFGTPQAMRSAIREYCGFLPSELRANPAE
jgi:AraC-like DNA-binding protein